MTEAESIVAAVRSVIGNKPVGLHDPFITDEDRANVAACLEDEPVGYGYIERFEAMCADACGRRYAVAVSSGTAALHLALIVSGIEGKEVPIPPLAFAALPSMVLHAGGQPVFTSSDQTLCFVDLLGTPPLGYFNPLGIEDAAEALGSSVRGKPCGSFGIASVLSFNCNKIVTTGGGGMLLTDDEGFAKEARHLATTAKVPSPWFYAHDRAAFNYRMQNHAAALGIGQVHRLKETVARKRELCRRYREALGEGIAWFDDGENWNHWLIAIRVEDRDATLRALTDAGIACRALFTPLHLQEPYRDCPRDEDLSAAEELWMHTVCLPSGAGVA